MSRATGFYRDKLGLELKFESPFWSEFATGDTVLALHPASEENPAGTVELGFAVDNLGEFYARRDQLGVEFTREPKEEPGLAAARRRPQPWAATRFPGAGRWRYTVRLPGARGWARWMSPKRPAGAAPFPAERKCWGGRSGRDQ